MRASSVRARIDRDIWDSYYKFCFERNPWDKTVSFYYWFGRDQNLPPFTEYIRNHRKYGTDDQTLPSDWTRYTLDDRLIVDDVFDYRDLSGGLRHGVAPCRRRRGRHRRGHARNREDRYPQAQAHNLRARG
jgi:hypothetical protein